MPSLPGGLAHSISERQRRVVLVVGAGCSLEAPTRLQLARTYSLKVHEGLVLDEVLSPGECVDPEDLSVLASAVVEKCGSQAEVVRRLPLREFRVARPNSGYLAAAALMLEGAVDAVLTLNFDLAMSNALSVLTANGIQVIAGPHAVDLLGPPTVVYLHRNVDEPDKDAWILTVEALDSAWVDDWQAVVAHRVMSSPSVVFAGLGSTASVLTATIARIRAAVSSDLHQVYLVDPNSETEFAAELDVPSESHLQVGWCEFMELLSGRVVQSLRAEFADVAQGLCDENGWLDSVAEVVGISERLHNRSLVELGMIRAKWLLDAASYVRDDERRALIADLALGVGCLERALGATARFEEDGRVTLACGDGRTAAVSVASGGGVLRWATFEAKVLSQFAPVGESPLSVLASGVQGDRMISPPQDVLNGDESADIIGGDWRPSIVSVDQLRGDPSIARELVA